MIQCTTEGFLLSYDDYCIPLGRDVEFATRVLECLRLVVPQDIYKRAIWQLSCTQVQRR